MIIFKPEVSPSDYQKLNPYLQIVTSYFHAYCLQHDLPCLVTSMISDRVEGGVRVSDTHKEARAIDLSVKGFDEFHKQRIKHFLNKKFGVEWGTRPIDSNVVPRVCLVHGEVEHFHLQVRRDICITDLD